MITGQSYELIPTAFGTVGIVWSSPRLLCKVFLPAQRVVIEKQIRRSFSPIQSRERSSTLSRRLQRYFHGEKIVFDITVVDMTCCSRFQCRVLKDEYMIPYGRVSTYGAIASSIDHPDAARAVGRALACNPFPLIIPCHRTIRADGLLGGFQGGVEMKRRLLMLEGVTFTPDGKVAPEWWR